MSFSRKLPLLLLVALFPGCGWWNDDKGIFVNRSDDYIDIEERRELIIPSDLDDQNVADPLPIPEGNTVLNAEYYPDKPPRPDAIFASDNRDEVRIQRLGDRRWLVIPEAATTVWPKVRQFLAENGVGIADQNPRFGRINTEWMDTSGEFRDVIRVVISDVKEDENIRGGKDRLLIRVEQGLRERNSEIHIRYENDRVSPPREKLVRNLNELPSIAPEIETEVLNEVGAYIASKVAEQSISRQGQTISAGVKSQVTRDSSGEPVLALELDYERAWATIAQALTRAEVEIVNLDQAAGFYEVLIPESLFSGRNQGWLGGLFGGGEKYDLLLRFRRTGEDRYYVSVLDSNDQKVERALSQEVLTMIREFAS